ncbi:MAG: hypothetical protein IT244_10160 [Bacteroidia bacterium]|nr:hypothetical protein [Bacteroidia bacterium]
MNKLIYIFLLGLLNSTNLELFGSCSNEQDAQIRKGTSLNFLHDDSSLIQKIYSVLTDSSRCNCTSGTLLIDDNDSKKQIVKDFPILNKLVEQSSISSATFKFCKSYKSWISIQILELNNSNIVDSLAVKFDSLYPKSVVLQNEIAVQAGVASIGSKLIIIKGSNKEMINFIFENLNTRFQIVRIK